MTVNINVSTYLYGALSIGMEQQPASKTEQTDDGRVEDTGDVTLPVEEQTMGICAVGRLGQWPQQVTIHCVY